ncbi:MAG: M28 family metallopeptidase [Defluviitaleaceae bacterium]|nr:M28 family metallopeptidase [Defluviitaleaceae bacterium]
MNRKLIFIVSLGIVAFILGIIIGNNHFFGGREEIYPEDYISETPVPTPTLQNEEEEYDYYIGEAPGYVESDDPVFEGDIENPWHPIHFQDIRPAQPLHPGVPHGYVALRHIRYLNDYFYSRFPFSYQEKRAAVWIIEELLAIGYTWDNIQVQEFDFMGLEIPLESAARWDGWVIYHNYDYFRNTYTSQNVILTVPGRSDQVIVVGAHYDTVLYPGASDNASGTALLLESAQRMRYVDNYYTIVYIFFGAEEVGLFGAEYYVMNLTDEELNQILFMVNADVLFEGPYFIFGGGYGERWPRAPRANNITRLWDEIADELNAYDGFDIISDPYAIFLSSDQLVFLDAGLTVMMLYGTDFSADGSMYFRVLHSYRDCYHYINDRWPYKIGDAMRTFSIFLERVLLAEY